MPFMLTDLIVLCENLDNLIEFLFDHNLLHKFSETGCPECSSKNIRLRPCAMSDGKYWLCKNCRRNISLRKASLFYKSHLTLPQIIKVVFYWVENYPQSLTKEEVRINCQNTIVDWYSFCREVCQEYLVNQPNRKIGGPGVVIEIDEFKCSKQKSTRRSQRSGGQWVLGGVECDNTGNVFLVRVPDWSVESLCDVIVENVEKGSVINTGCWKPHSRLTELDFENLAANHSIKFEHPVGGDSANAIEGTWQWLRNSLNSNGTRKEHFESYLAAFMVRRKFLNCAEDPFFAFLQLIATLFPTPKKEN